MDEDLRAIYEVDRVIHEPARLVITALLYGAEEVDFLYLLRESGLTKGNLSSHLMKLEQAGYVSIEKGYAGKVPRTTIKLASQGQRAFETYQERIRRGLPALAD